MVAGPLDACGCGSACAPGFVETFFDAAALAVAFLVAAFFTGVFLAGAFYLFADGFFFAEGAGMSIPGMCPVC
jgi:hypothetical protein